MIKNGYNGGEDMRDNFEDIGISDDFMFGTVMRNPEYCFV